MTKFRNMLHGLKFKRGHTDKPQRPRRLLRKGTPHCRIIHTEISGGRERTFHATKGWRSNRIVQ